MRNFFLLLTGIASVLMAPWAHSLELTEPEKALLPAYCHNTQLIGGEVTYAWTPAAQRWVNRWGAKNHSHLHHFCWAKANYARSLRARTPAMERKAMRESAIGDINYSIQHSTPDFELHADMHTLRGVLLNMNGRVAEAESSLKAALTYNAKYVPAYVELIALYKSSGNKSEERGIRAKAAELGVSIPQ
jgi:hypothetical protein